MIRKRIVSFIIDYFIIIIIANILIMVLFNSITDEYKINNIFILIVLILMLFKDLIFINKSIGKKLMKLEIKTINNEKPSMLKLILRNITIFIWPIEFIILMINGFRLSDKILKLQVQDLNNPNINENQQYTKKQLLLTIIVIGILIILTIFIFLSFSKKSDNLKIPYPEKIETILEFMKNDDMKSFEIRYYKPNDIKYIKELKQSKEINSDKDKLYNKVIKDHYLKYLSKEEKEKFNKYFNWQEIIKRNNYYILLERKTEKRPYVFDLMIIDDKENIVYSIYCNYCY